MSSTFFEDLQYYIILTYMNALLGMHRKPYLLN